MVTVLYVWPSRKSVRRFPVQPEMTADEEDCSTFLLDDEALTLELDFAELLLFTELLLDDFLVVVEDDDLTMLDDESSEDDFAGLLSSPQAAKKRAIQREAQRTSLFILRNIKKSRLG